MAENYSSFFLMLHLFAMVLGLGGATYTDILLMHFLKDFKISPKEAGVIQVMSTVILIGIGIAFLSGIMLFLPKAAELLQTPKFIVKNIIFLVLIANGFVLHKLILPKLVQFSFHKEVWIWKNILTLRHLGFISGGLSIVSWYAVFFLGTFKNIPFSFWELLGAYILAVVVAIFVGLLIERKIQKSLK